MGVKEKTPLAAYNAIFLMYVKLKAAFLAVNFGYILTASQLFIAVNILFNAFLAIHILAFINTNMSLSAFFAARILAFNDEYELEAGFIVTVSQPSPFAMEALSYACLLYPSRCV